MRDRLVRTLLLTLLLGATFLFPLHRLTVFGQSLRVGVHHRKGCDIAPLKRLRFHSAQWPRLIRVEGRFDDGRERPPAAQSFPVPSNLKPFPPRDGNTSSAPGTGRSHFPLRC